MHLPRSNCVSWSCIARNPPAGAVQSAQWRELDASSSRAPAKSPAVMRCARRLSKLRFSSLSVWNRRRGKETMRASRPHTPRQVRITCTSANRVCRLLRSWCRCFASAAIQLRKLVVRSTKSPAGAVQSTQWRELDLSSSRTPAESPVVMRCPVGSRNFVPCP